MALKLSTLSIFLGLLVSAINGYGVMNPPAFKEWIRKLPRSVPIGCVLMLLATVWFVWNVQNESIADFENLKPFLCILFIVVGIGSCIFVKDFLGARGVAVMLLMLAKLMVDTARWHESTWRLVIVIWAYILVIIGVWFTISPWRMRDIIEWNTSDEKKTRALCSVRLLFGLLVLILGIVVF